ncbi:unnamed protein product [Blepharisma stoltei]|uniref:Uncharacterized protein n=1 Tax=Blepharisma stoltei TaxID=1481888 RepID=A0AAU9JZU2_9CILI|nr:unnamed protein product [Blepharisma stoltei]
MIWCILGFLIEILGGVVYPAFKTLSFVNETKQDYDKDFMTWTFYWFAFAVLQTLGWYLDSTLYAIFKILVIILLVAPKVGGSILVYNTLKQFGGSYVEVVSAKIREFTQKKQD